MPTWETVGELGAELPGTEQGTWYGTPALKVRGTTFYIAPHYEDWPAMSVNLERIERQELRERLIRRPIKLT